MLICKFLTKFEYIRTLDLFIECFGDDAAYIRELYGELDGEDECTGSVKNHEIVVIENEQGQLLSMIHIRPMRAVYDSGKRIENVSYLMCVATRKAARRQGLMDRAMQAVFTKLRLKGESWCFLVAVDKEIYRHLGFIYDWDFNKGEELLLDADEGLTQCTAKLLSPVPFRVPEKLLAGFTQN